MQTRLKSGVLQLTLGIGIIIGVLCMAMIMVVYYAKLFFLQHSVNDNLASNATSGIHYLMAEGKNFPYNKTRTLDLFHEEIDTVELTRRRWGLFDLVTTRSIRGNHEVVKSALLAAETDTITQSCLYIPNSNALIYMVGTALLRGNAYLPGRGLTPGSIKNNNFKSDRLIYGKMKKSNEHLPFMDTLYIHALQEILNGRDSMYHLKDIPENENRKHFSFDDLQPNYYYSSSSLHIDDSLSGNLIIHSATKVTITSTARLNDVIVMAPEIEILPGFNGRLQCIATEYIDVGEGSKLLYPSALVLAGKEMDSLIVVRSGAVVEGYAIIAGYNAYTGNAGLFKIEKDAVFHGIGYINCAAEIEGEVWGHLSIQSFNASEGTADYPNHFMDGTIDRTKCSVYMPAALLWGNSGKRIIAKWLP